MTRLLLRLYRRYRARTWDCRCGHRVFTDGCGCEWHPSVRAQVLDGTITQPEQAR
jgi:hypothetical protein